MPKSRLPSASQVSVDQFLAEVNRLPAAPASQRGRLIFAMDATASREPMWELASHLHARMFEQVASTEQLAVQLCYYRGFREFEVSDWVHDAQSLARDITRVRCAAGRTQIARVLQHGLAEQARQAVSALVFIGDCVEESADMLGDLAGRLGIHNVRLFLFQEGAHPATTRVFKQMARVSNGAHCRFDANSAEQLGALLSAVAVYAAGGKQALLSHRLAQQRNVRALLTQLK